MTTEKQYINKAKQNKVTLSSSNTVKDVTTRSTRQGVAGNGSLSYNISWKHPKPGVRKQGDLWK